MPYINLEEVVRIRRELKKNFPGWKFSVRKHHYTAVIVAILSGPVDLGLEYHSVNQYNIDRMYHGRVKEVLQAISDIMRKNVKIMSVDADYGSITNFYTNLRIGTWEDPFRYTGETEDQIRMVGIVMDEAQQNAFVQKTDTDLVIDVQESQMIPEAMKFMEFYIQYQRKHIEKYGIYLH
jgi:hypothetical protein